LSICETRDGSISLRSSNFKQLFHSLSGAKKESLEKYINPSELNRFKPKEILVALDVCLGMGYNSACLIEAVRNKKVYLKWYGLELDKNPLKIALENSKYRSTWSINIIKTLERIESHNQFKDSYGEGNVLWGDARKTINLIPKSLKFDLIYLDPFSPQQCPELWSEEFLC